MTTITPTADETSTRAITTGTRRRSKVRAPRTARDYAQIGLWIALVICLAVWAMPLIFILFTSLKTQAEIYGTPAFAPPGTLNLANFPAAVATGGLFQAAGNSLLIAVIKVPIGLMISAAAAFALARLKFKRQQLLLLFIFLGSMVPVQVAIGPLFSTILNLGLLNTYAGVILPYLAFGLPYQTFILYGFFKAIPAELDESARIDGAGNWRLFFQIILPLAKPALAALFILDFVATWNEYGMALVLLQSREMWTIPLAIQSFQSEFTAQYGPLNAFTLMSILPVLIVYLMFLSATVENEAIATGENEATQTDWVGDLGGRLGIDSAAGRGWGSAAAGREAAGYRQVNGR